MFIYRSRDRIAVIAATVAAAVVPFLEIHSHGLDRRKEIDKMCVVVLHPKKSLKKEQGSLLIQDIKMCLLTAVVAFADSCCFRMSWAALSITT